MPFPNRTTAAGLPFALAAGITPGIVFFAPRAPTPIVVAVVLAGLAIAYWRRERPAAADRGLAVLLVSLWVWAVASVIWTPDLYLGARGVLKLAGNLLVGMILLTLARRLGAAECLPIGWALIGGLLAALVLLGVELLLDAPIKRLLWGGMPVDENFRHILWLYGFSWANPCASVVAVFLWPAMIVARRAKVPFLGGGIFIAAILVNYGIGYATGILGLISGAAAATFVFVFRKWGGVILAGLLVIDILAAPLLTTVALKPKTFSQMTDIIPLEVVHRLHIWQFANRHISEHPLRGWGMNASRTLPGGKLPLYDMTRKRAVGYAMPLHPHNLALQMWLELGFPGAAILAALVFLILLRLTRSGFGRVDMAIACGQFLTGFSILSFSYGAWQSWWQATMWLGAAFTAATLPPQQEANGS